MPTLEDAIILAAWAHKGQTEFNGSPYIMHPLRVMMGVKTETGRMAAVLHDVVEDTTYTLDDLRQAGYPEDVVAAVDSLSRREDESYSDYIQRLKQNPLAVRVKLCDLRDNMDLLRLQKIYDHDLKRFRRYRYAWRELTGE